MPQSQASPHCELGNLPKWATSVMHLTAVCRQHGVWWQARAVPPKFTRGASGRWHLSGCTMTETSLLRLRTNVVPSWLLFSSIALAALSTSLQDGGSCNVDPAPA